VKQSLVHQLTHPNPLVGVFTLGMINRVLGSYSDPKRRLTALDTRLIDGLF